jgi:hypothetical protein
VLVLGAGVIFALASSLAVLPSALAGGGTEARHIAAEARVGSVPAQPVDFGSAGGAPEPPRLVPRGLDGGLGRSCRPASWQRDYVNPLAHARVKPERIDQGVDYQGSGKLTAIGLARVTHVATTGTGWPGSFIEYRLLDGLDAGCYVYYAEGVKPATGVRVGQTVAAGQPVAKIISGWESGIEIGWGAGVNTTTLAAKGHQWSPESDAESTPTAAGKSFSALLSSLGGPPGKVEG